MTSAQMANVDLIMDSEYQAQRSNLTNKEWINICKDAWICSYINRAEFPSEKSDLYIVQVYQPTMRIIIYKPINV